MNQYPNDKLRGQLLPIARPSRPEQKRNPQPTGERTFILALGLCLLMPGMSIADESASALTLHYFGTAGLTHVTSGQADFVRDISQPDGVKGGQWSATVDSLVGGQANLKINEQLEVVGQAVSRHRYDDTYIPELTWAFAKYSPRPDVELRGGRLGTDFYMRSDSRLVGYSYLPVRPSVDYYGDLAFQSLDGLDGAFTIPLGKGLLRAKAFGGYNEEKIPLENSEPWDISGSLLLGGSLDYQWDSWQFRFGYAQLSYERDLPGSFTTLMTALRRIPLQGTQAANALAVGGTITAIIRPALSMTKARCKCS
jgi:hypothetical protein